MTDWPLLLAAEGTLRRTFEFGRIRVNSDWILPVLICVGILLLVRTIYVRDARKLSRVLAALLTLLRSVVFFALLVFYLQPQWRCEREVLRNSQTVLLIDTSSSMGLIDPSVSESVVARSRLDRLANALQGGDFVAMLRRTQDTVIQSFDAELNEIAVLTKLDEADDEPAVDCFSHLQPVGRETHLGGALAETIRRRSGEPLAAVVVFSDGGQNAGLQPQAAIELARQADLPIHTVGIGSTVQPANVRVYRVEAIPRAFPGDPFSVSGLIQSQGADNALAGRTVTVELLQRDGGRDTDATEEGTGAMIGSRQVTLGVDGQSVPVKFEVTPNETGLRTLCLRVRPPSDDRDTEDDFLETEVEVVDRRDRVLLLAGGPTREYRFLRTQLYRDASMTLDVYLQTAQPGISQEADQVLDDFPATRQEMFAYDCVIAFDPDWQALSVMQIELLESWVAEQAGGLIVVAGSVNTGEPVGGWVQNPEMKKIRDLYPVEFPKHVAVWDVETQTAEEPWPLDFTREGIEAEYLWLDDTAIANQQAWGSFQGVYSFQPLRGAKPAATVLARFADPRALQGDEAPIFLATQFYGSGRVFYIASGEFWRLRAVEPGHFERLYTRLIRHVSQGRLLRQSSRGVLLVDRDRFSLGSTINVRAQLTDVRLAPLDVLSVALEVFLPDGLVRVVTMPADPTRIGAYQGSLTVLREGLHRLELPVPGGNERIVRRLRVEVPDLERQAPRRNEALLRRLAEETGGRYYADLAEAVDTADPKSLVHQLKDHTRTVILAAAPDRLWNDQRLPWLMVTLCSLLCLEWLLRRLAKLA